MQRLSGTTLIFTFAFLLGTLIGATDVDAQRIAPKKLAPNVLKVIAPDLQERDGFTLPMALPGLNVQPYEAKYAAKKNTLYGQTRNVVFFRDVWQYEFAFTGLRQMRIRVRDANGQVGDKNIWYIVYRVRDVGKSFSFEDVKSDPRFPHTIKKLVKDKPVATSDRQFSPRFTLNGWVANAKNQYREVSYRDEFNDQIVQLISKREDPHRQMLGTLEMKNTAIPLAKSAESGGVWGIAFWEGVNPNIDFVSLHVHGFTNAYRIDAKPDGSAVVRKRTLQLNFWRPGDSVYEVADKVRYGIPLVDDSAEQVNICERYHLPGPVIRGYHPSQQAKTDVLVMETDAKVSLEDFKSELLPELRSGKMPASVAKAFAASGITIPNDVALKNVVPEIKWEFKDAEGKGYYIEIEPQFWEASPHGGIRFIKSLDHFWIYR